MQSQSIGFLTKTDPLGDYLLHLAQSLQYTKPIRIIPHALIGADDWVWLSSDTCTYLFCARHARPTERLAQICQAVMTPQMDDEPDDADQSDMLTYASLWLHLPTQR